MKGIIFTENNFLLTIDRIKKQTRRIINPQPDFFDEGKPYCETDFRFKTKSRLNEDGEHWFEIKPRYKVGETVYLKEPYFLYDEKYLELKTTNGLEVSYKYGNNLSLEEITGKSGLKWESKLFMPESAARYFIKITDVRAERLQDISDEDCIKEGILEERNWGNGTEWFTYSNGTYSFGTPREAYAALINEINGAGTWKDNPFVWVYDYEHI